MTKNVVVVGVQWGDEGKGKVVDVLAADFDVVVRYQGGANAGHTVIANGKKFVLQLIPTGILRPEKIAVLGNGVVVDPVSLLEELDAIQNAGVRVGDRLLISDRAHLILPYHRTHEAAAEQARGLAKLGTTAKGIGPSYEDKTGRRGLRACDLRNPSEFRRKCTQVLEEKNRLASAFFPKASLAPEGVVERYLETATRIVPHLADTSAYLNAAMDGGKSVLFEGAQGTLLDLDCGTYPFVTSSSAAAGGACTGAGVGPMRIHGVVGVSKAYATRVGSGPFPTEVFGPESEKIRERGGEYGAVTGRPRRCGWFDVPAARYAARLNGLSGLVITKLDILDHLAEIPVGVQYEYRGAVLADFPPEIDVLEGLQVRYQKMPGWQQSTFGLRDYTQLPSQARDYLTFLSDEVGVKTIIVSTGPERDQAIRMADLSVVGSP
jgi:adenylosuccinate synthase